MQFNKNRIKNIVLLISLCIIYAGFVYTFGFGIPCIFHLITGLLCPGCGITHMYLSMLKLDFRSAFYSNSFLFITQPIIYYFVVKIAVFYLKGSEIMYSKFENILLYSLIIGLLIFSFIRNVSKLL